MPAPGTSSGRVEERASAHLSVAATWTVVAGPPSRTIIAADGSFDLIVSIDPLGRARAFVHRPEARAHVAWIERDHAMVGVRLRPGHGAALSRHGEDVTTRAARWLEKGNDPLRLESFVAELVEDRGRPPSVLADFVADATDRSGRVRLTAPGSAARERALQRVSREWLGVTPKAFLRIERARAACAAIRRGEPLAAVAADLGYADQAHLTREIHGLVGSTPRQQRFVGIVQERSVRRS